MDIKQIIFLKMTYIHTYDGGSLKLYWISTVTDIDIQMLRYEKYIFVMLQIQVANR